MARKRRTNNHAIEIAKAKRLLIKEGYGVKDLANKSLDELTNMVAALGDSSSTVTIEGKPITVETAIIDTKPKEQKPAMTTNHQEQAINTINDALKALAQPVMDENRIIELINEHSEQAVLSVEVKNIETKETKKIEGTHKQFKDVLNITQLGLYPYLVGAAAGGKTTLTMQVAEALSVPYYSQGRVLEKFELLGYLDANSRLVETAFKKAYTEGGLFAWDEFDSSSEAAVVAVNAAIDNGFCTFPDSPQPVNKHKDFYLIASGNTNGLGATRQYTGRNPLDGSTLDRFVEVQLEYDTKLEKQIALAAYKSAGGETESTVIEWLEEVWSLRAKVKDKKLNPLITPRASRFGSMLLAQGFNKTQVREMVLYKHLTSDQRKQLKVG